MSVTGARLQPTLFELSRPGRGGGNQVNIAECTDRTKPERSMLGRTQEQWLEQALAARAARRMRRRRDLDARRPAGRVRLPDYATRERIYQAWRAIGDPAPRVRYYRLHQEFQHVPIAVLETVVREFEADA